MQLDLPACIDLLYERARANSWRPKDAEKIGRSFVGAKTATRSISAHFISTYMHMPYTKIILLAKNLTVTCPPSFLLAFCLFVLFPFSIAIDLKRRRNQSVPIYRFTYLFSLRPYSHYPGYTTGRFGRFRSPRQPPQAMATRSKKYRASHGSSATPISTAWTRVGPLYRVPRLVGTKAFGMSSWEEPGLAEVEMRPTTVCRSRQERQCNAQVEVSWARSSSV